MEAHPSTKLNHRVVVNFRVTLSCAVCIIHAFNSNSITRATASMVAITIQVIFCTGLVKFTISGRVRSIVRYRNRFVHCNRNSRSYYANQRQDGRDAANGFDGNAALSVCGKTV